jgi:hypothetical protein
MKGVQCTTADGPCERSLSQVRVRGDSILLSQIWDSLNTEGLVPVFIFTRNRVAQLYRKPLGSLLVASYGWQCCNGDIRIRLHAEEMQQLTGPVYNISALAA